MRALVAVFLFQDWAALTCLHVLLKAVDEFITLSCVGLGTVAVLGCVLHGGNSGYRWEFWLETWMTHSKIPLYYLTRTQSLLLFLTLVNHNFEPQLICEALKNWGSCISLISYFLSINLKLHLFQLSVLHVLKNVRLQKPQWRSLPLYSMRPCFHKYTPSSTNSVYILCG